jgi:KUP system potassium uptake protein
VIFWALMLVVTLKYVTLILRADNRGEGGGLALTALAAQAVGAGPGLRRALLLLGCSAPRCSMATASSRPAISVLGAMEGLEVVPPRLKPYVVPISAGHPGRPVPGAARTARPWSGGSSGRSSCCGSATLARAGRPAAHRARAVHPAALNPLHAWQFLLAARLEGLA